MSNIYNIFSQQRRVGAQLFGEEETDAATDIEQPTVVPYSSKAPLGKSVDDALRDMKLRDAMNTKLGDVGGGTQMPPDNTGNIYDDGNITAIGNAEKPLEEVQNGTNQTATPETTMSKAATTEPSATNAGSSDYQFASPELQNKAEKEWKKLMKDEYAVSKVTDILEKNLEGKDRQNKFVYKTELAKALKEYGVPGMEDKPTSGVYKTSKELTINGKPLEDDSKIGMLPTTKLVIDKWAKENPDAPIPPVTEYTNTMKQTNPNEVVRYNGNDYVTNIQQAQDYADKLARMRASVNPTDTKVKGLQGINNWDDYQGYLADKAKVEEYNKNLNSAGGQYTGSDLAFQMKKKKLVDEVLLYDSTNGQKGISYDQWNNVQGGENITTADGRLIAMPVSTFSGGGKKGEKMEMPKKVEPVIVDIIGTATAKTVTDDTNRYSNGGGTQPTNGEFMLTGGSSNLDAPRGTTQEYTVTKDGGATWSTGSAHIFNNINVPDMGTTGISNVRRMYPDDLTIGGIKNPSDVDARNALWNTLEDMKKRGIPFWTRKDIGAKGEDMASVQQWFALKRYEDARDGNNKVLIDLYGDIQKKINNKTATVDEKAFYYNFKNAAYDTNGKWDADKLAKSTWIEAKAASIDGKTANRWIPYWGEDDYAKKLQAFKADHADFSKPTVSSRRSSRFYPWLEKVGQVARELKIITGTLSPDIKGKYRSGGAIHDADANGGMIMLDRALQ